MAKEKKPSWINYLKGATKKKHSKAGREYIKSMKAQGRKWDGSNWVKPSAYYGGAKRGRKTADEILREIKGKK